MADERGRALFIFSVLAIVLASCFIVVADGDADVSVTQAAASIGISTLSSQKQVTAISTQKDVVMHLGASGGGRAGGFSGARGGGFGSTGGSSSGSSRGSPGGSYGKTKGGASTMPFWMRGAAVGAYGGSQHERHNGGSQSWNNYVVVSAAATVVGIAAIVA